MGQLVRACEGLYDICKAYGAPLVSGKDSMKNNFRGKDKRGEKIEIAILPTLMVTAMARVEMGTTPGSAFKNAGDIVYLIGEKGAGFAGAEIAELFHVKQLTNALNPLKNIDTYRRIHRAMKDGLFSSVHDVSEGGALVAAAESAVGGRLGMKWSADAAPEFLFNEAAGRFVVSVPAAKKAAFEKTFETFTLLGEVTQKDFAVATESVTTEQLVSAWKRGF
jgi:phosphoribosylformylglycinamidine synthase